MPDITFDMDGITVDARVVAEGFGIGESKLRTLMQAGTITTRCETGQGEDAGRTRLNFLYGNRVLRLIVDADGTLIEAPRIEFTNSAFSDARRRGNAEQ